MTAAACIIFIPVFLYALLVIITLWRPISSVASVAAFGKCPHFDLGDHIFTSFEGQGLLIPERLFDRCFAPLFNPDALEISPYILLSGELSDYRHFLPEDIKKTLPDAHLNSEDKKTIIYVQIESIYEHGYFRRSLDEASCNLSTGEYKSCSAGTYFFKNGGAALYYFDTHRSNLETEFEPIMEAFIKHIDN